MIYEEQLGLAKLLGGEPGALIREAAGRRWAAHCRSIPAAACWPAGIPSGATGLALIVEAVAQLRPVFHRR